MARKAKMRKKLAVIRDDTTKCPYSLPISEACKTAGESVHQMTPFNKLPENASEELTQKISKDNLDIYEKNKGTQHCIYAANVFKNKPGTVDCDFGDSAAGIGHENAFIDSSYNTNNVFPIAQNDSWGYPARPDSKGDPDSVVDQYGTNHNQYYDTYQWASGRVDRLIKRAKVLKQLKKQ
jgi:hypothetical protein